MTHHRWTTVWTIAVALFAATFAYAAGSDDENDEPPDDRDRPLDAGIYGAVAYMPIFQDTQRLAAKLPASPPFATYTPALDFELHFFGRSAAILGISGGMWKTQSKDDLMDTDLSGWDIQLDVGTPVAEYRLGTVSVLVGLGYAQNHLRFEGDFAALDNSDEHLPTGKDAADLYQTGFVYDVALRTDFRDPFLAGERGAGLVVSGFSMGYKSVPWSTKWMRGGDEIANLPYVAEHMLFARLHVGLGGGAYLRAGED
ncbi:MAG: hypothetical protein IT350_02780 [Deltaproteobacteria bacterium]|nr:hypothetical protein [Deltaproteobacteria bacterium]